jgi:uncharacterized protein YggT (Ycf19 family)
MALTLTDFILNLAGLLLWLNWRSLRFDPLARAAAASLAGTLKRTDARRLRGWQFLAGLALLLLARALLLWPIGAAADWTPKLELWVVTLVFRCDHLALRADVLGPALVFSGLSFLRVLLVFYCWLLVLAAINRHPGEAEPALRMLRAHLGRAGHWPWYVQWVLPLAVVTVLWIALHPLLLALNITGRVQSFAHLLEQGLLVGAALYLSLKYILPVILLVHLVLSYVYLGPNPAWDFVNVTARHLLAPLRWLPLRLAAVDFAPLLGAALILLLLHVLPTYGSQWAETRLHLSIEPIWPQ